MIKKIKQIKLLYKAFKQDVPISLSYTEALNNCRIIIESKEVLKLEYLHLQITFEEEICKWRNFDYSWVDITKNRASNDLLPKIIKFKNNLKVLPSKNIGQWEVNPKNKNRIVWKLIDKSLNSRVSFDKNNIKTSVYNPQLLKKKLELSLLFTKKEVPEVSRSKIPFSSIFCFTDHCDYDSELLLEKQRLFFKELDIKTTKGFFLNHFSKRNFNTSLEKEKEEFDKWLKEGHELAYHSLTQSIREPKVAEREFIEFKQPSKEIVTWIDHGYQPYNLSLCKKEKIEAWFNLQKTKNISVFWTFNDYASSGEGIINQLNLEQFTPNQFLKSLKHFSLKNKVQFFIRNYLFFFSNNNKVIGVYKNLAGNFKKVFYQKKIKFIFKLFSSILFLFFYFLKELVLWKKKKNNVSENVSNSPVIFSDYFNGHKFSFFNTIEMNDFDIALSKTNIKTLIAENGICIAHTYFSVLLPYYKGRLFLNAKGELNPLAVAAFKNLSKEIKNKKIWNPTLAELINHLELYKDCIFEINDKDEITIANDLVSYRYIL